MAFTPKNAFNATSDMVRLDKSQIDKLSMSGLAMTAVSTDIKSLANTTLSTKDVGSGIKVTGYQDTKGDFYVVDNNNVIYNVVDQPTTPNNVSTTITSTPITQPPVQTGGPMPPTNLGSGKIYSWFETGDIVPNQQEIVTRALWSGNVGNLVSFFTSSAQTTRSKDYYYAVYNSGSGDCGSEPQFAVAWGHKQGSGSADQGGDINDTPSRAIYGQYKQLCLDPDQERFVVGGSATDNIYVINVNRARMREFIDEGNLELNLQALSGSEWLTGGGLQNAWTGSNVKVSPTRRVTRLIDDSRVNPATITTAGEVYNIVSGTLEDGIYNSAAPHTYGLLYRRLGVIVLNGTTLDMSASFLTVTGSEVSGDNAYKLFTSISGSAKYTDTSGDYLGFQGRSGEKVKSSHHFVRVKNQDYNFSNNPTFITGSEGDLSQPLMIGNPQTYITTIGLYNNNKELIGVAKMNKPLNKNFNNEALIKVKMTW